jgi:AcrR family transcriptional regulator
VAETKDRIIEATAELFKRRGYAGTGLKQIVADASAPFGSIYHFFPGGKQQLAAEVIVSEGRMYQQLVTDVLDSAPDIVTGIERSFQAAADVLETTNFVDACPIETIALEVASTNEELRKACAEVFESWIAAGIARHERAGASLDVARELTILFIAALEGAFVLCRTQRNTEALHVAGRAVAAAARQALARTPRQARSSTGSSPKRRRRVAT